MLRILFSIYEGESEYWVMFNASTLSVLVWDPATQGEVFVSNPSGLPEEGTVFSSYDANEQPVLFKSTLASPYAERYIVPAAGTVIRTQCYGTDLYNVVADGYGNEVQGALVEANSLSCGYVPPVDCVASFPFKLDPVRGERYFVQFPDYSGNMHRIGYWLNGYTGEPEEIRGAGDPGLIDWPGTGDKLSILSGSGLTTNILVQRYGLLEEFYTTDERKYRVDHSINGQLNWRGYHIPDIYNEPLKAVPFHASLQSHDGIAALENMPYLNPAGERYYGRVRTVDVIARCLRKLDLDIPVWLAINVWEDTADLNVEPLSQVYADQSGYYDDENEPLSCGEVLKRILDPYKAYIIQVGAQLHIIRRNEVQGPYKRRLMYLGKGDTTLEVDVSEEVFEDVHTIVLNPGETGYREGSQALATQPAIKYVATITEYGDYESFLYNGDFERWSAGRPLFWSGQAQVARVTEGNKHALQFLNIHNTESQLQKEKVINAAYENEVDASKGLTFKFDYTVTIRQFMPVEGAEWVSLPGIYFGEGAFGVSTGEPGRVSFNGVERLLPVGDIQTGITIPNGLRIDAAYVTETGYGYVSGTVTGPNVMPQVPNIPSGALLLTYLCFENEKVTFTSVPETVYTLFYFVIRIGNYYLRARNQRTYNNSPVSYGWFTGGNPTPVAIPAYEFKAIANGAYEAKGTLEIDLDPLQTPGVPYVEVWEPAIHRSKLDDTTVVIDNVSLTELVDDTVQKMIIAGENAGHTNTPPYELTLHHGSGIPRTQALLTLADGRPAQTFNGGNLLQELTARDILAQHVRTTYVLNATVRGNSITPLTTLIDPFYPNRRFYPDAFTHRLREGLKDVSALEEFGGLYDALPDRIRVTMDFKARVTNAQDYRTIN